MDPETEKNERGNVRRLWSRPFTGRRMHGLRPLVESYISQLPHSVLFWLNSISAVVDNATLTAAEIGPKLTMAQQRGILMGLLISGVPTPHGFRPLRLMVAIGSLLRTPRKEPPLFGKKP